MSSVALEELLKVFLKRPLVTLSWLGLGDCMFIKECLCY